MLTTIKTCPRCDGAGELYCPRCCGTGSRFPESGGGNCDCRRGLVACGRCEGVGEIETGDEGDNDGE